jgi:hypothetical protein
MCLREVFDRENRICSVFLRANENINEISAGIRVAEIPPAICDPYGMQTASSSAESVWLDRILSQENIRAASARVKGNRGAAGIDGITIPQLAPRFAAE